MRNNNRNVLANDGAKKEGVTSYKTKLAMLIINVTNISTFGRSVDTFCTLVQEQ